MHIHLAHIKQQLNQLWIWMVRKDAFIYLLFVALATLVWWGRAMTSQREITIKLPITYTDIPAEIVFDTPLPSQIEITLRDNGRLLRQVQHTQPNITISLSDKFEEGSNQLYISTDILRPRVQDMLPGSTTIQQIRPEEIVSSYHIDAIKRTPIHLRVRWTIEEQYQLTQAPIMTPDSVTIYGPQQLLDSIDAICTDDILVEKVVGTIKKEVGLRIPNGVRSQFTTTEVMWQTEQFTEKSFIVPIEMATLPAGETIHFFPKTTTVTARVSLSQFATLSAQDFRAVCEYPHQSENILTVKIVCTNPHVTQMRSSIHEVEYIIERKQ